MSEQYVGLCLPLSIAHTHARTHTQGAIDVLSAAPTPSARQPSTFPVEHTSPIPADSDNNVFSTFWNFFGTAQGAQESDTPASFPPPLSPIFALGVQDTEKWKGVLFYVAGYVFLKSYVGVQADVRNFIFTPVSQFTRKRLQLAVLNHLHSLSHKYHIGKKTGAVLHVVDRGCYSLQTLLSLVAFNVVPALLDMVLCGGVFIYSGHTGLAAVTGATMVIYLWITAVVTDWRTKFRKETLALEGKAKQRAIESITHYEAVKLFNGAPREAKVYGEAMDSLQVAEVQSEYSLFLLNFAQQAVMGVGLMVSMTSAARQVLRGDMSVGDLVLVNTYLLQLYQPLNWIGSIYRMIQQNFVEMEQLFALLNQHLDIVDAPNATSLDGPQPHVPQPHVPHASPDSLTSNDATNDATNGATNDAISHGNESQVGSDWSIMFDQVSFSYDPRREVLRNVSFVIRPGETVAVVGPSGSGKSTLARLLCRLYDPLQGSVKIGGVDLRDATLASVRRVVGVVPQDTALFQHSIHYNIAYANEGDQEATDQQVEAAAVAAQMHDRILSFPDGYESQVGERGLRLSGGERQRLSLARILLKQAPIILLDEATSALDSGTEAQVQLALMRACSNRTSMVIAHRLSTISHASRIVVLVNGSVAEEGTHIQLLALAGQYAEMWQLQQHSERQLADNVSLPPTPRPATDIPRPPATAQAASIKEEEGSNESVDNVGQGASQMNGAKLEEGSAQQKGLLRNRLRGGGGGGGQDAEDSWWKAMQDCVSLSPALQSSLQSTLQSSRRSDVQADARQADARQALYNQSHSSLKDALLEHTLLEHTLLNARFLEPSESKLVMQLYGGEEEGGEDIEGRWPPIVSATSYHAPRFPAHMTSAEAQARLHTPDAAFLLLNFSYGHACVYIRAPQMLVENKRVALLELFHVHVPNVPGPPLPTLHAGRTIVGATQRQHLGGRRERQAVALSLVRPAMEEIARRVATLREIGPTVSALSNVSGMPCDALRIFCPCAAEGVMIALVAQGFEPLRRLPSPVVSPAPPQATDAPRNSHCQCAQILGVPTPHNHNPLDSKSRQWWRVKGTPWRVKDPQTHASLKRTHPSSHTHASKRPKTVTQTGNESLDDSSTKVLQPGNQGLDDSVHAGIPQQIDARASSVDARASNVDARASNVDACKGKQSPASTRPRLEGHDSDQSREAWRRQQEEGPASDAASGNGSGNGSRSGSTLATIRSLFRSMLGGVGGADGGVGGRVGGWMGMPLMPLSLFRYAPPPFFRYAPPPFFRYAPPPFPFPSLGHTLATGSVHTLEEQDEEEAKFHVHSLSHEAALDVRSMSLLLDQVSYVTRECQRNVYMYISAYTRTYISTYTCIWV